MSDKATTIAELESAYAKFRQTIDTVPDIAWEETMLGQWKLNHLLAHMAGWAKEMTRSIQRVGAGQPPTPEGVSYANADIWNAKFASTASPGKYSIVSFEHAFSRYIDAAKGLNDDLFGQNAEGKPKIGNRLLTNAGIGHFKEHQEELNRWLASRK